MLDLYHHPHFKNIIIITIIIITIVIILFLVVYLCHLNQHCHRQHPHHHHHWHHHLVFQCSPYCGILIKLCKWNLIVQTPPSSSVPSGYPNPTRYPVFLLIPDPTQFSFRNHRVAGNPKHRVLPDISGKPEVSGTTRHLGYHP